MWPTLGGQQGLVKDWCWCPATFVHIYRSSFECSTVQFVQLHQSFDTLTLASPKPGLSICSYRCMVSSSSTRSPVTHPPWGLLEDGGGIRCSCSRVYSPPWYLLWSCSGTRRWWSLEPLPYCSPSYESLMQEIDKYYYSPTTCLHRKKRWWSFNIYNKKSSGCFPTKQPIKKLPKKTPSSKGHIIF